MDREQILQTVKSNEWSVQAFSAHPLYLLIAASDSGWTVKEAFGVGYSHFFYTFEKGRAHMYYDLADWRKIAQAYKECVKSIGHLQSLIKSGDETYYKHVKLADAEGLDLLEKVIRLIRRLKYACGFAHAIEGITYGSELDLRQVLVDKGVFDEITFSKLCTPEQPSFLSNAQQELWGIKNAVSDEKHSKANAFLRDFSWIENTYLGSSNMTVANVLQKANDMTEGPRASEFENIRKEKEDLMRKFDFGDDERFLVATINAAFKWQDDRKRNILESIEALEPALKALAEESTIDFTSLKYALPNEITSEHLASLAFKEVLDARKEGCAIYSSSKGDSICVGKDFTYLAQQLHIDVSDDISEFKGTVACKGVVRGTVRVCYSVSDIPKVQAGEILVASMTRPEYLPAMQRAAGFVTDEGGITSHAAIVSRELRKPCIIGTKMATRILKDGDIVEVDANSGIVKILSPYTVEQAKSVT